MNAQLASYQEETLFEFNGYTAQLCISPESKEIAYELRYQAYLHVDAIEANEEERFTDAYDRYSNSRVHLVWHEGKPIASVRSATWSSSYNWLPPESIQTFWNEVHKTIGLEHNIIESSRFVVSPEVTGRKSLYAQLLMFRILDLCTQVDDCPYVITSVRQRHVPFYQRMLAFEQISEPVHHDWIKAEIVLLSTSQEKSREVVQSKGMPPCTTQEVERYAEMIQPFNAPLHAL